MPPFGHLKSIKKLIKSIKKLIENWAAQNVVPRSPQDRPRPPQDPPKSAPGPSKSAPRDPQDPLTCPKCRQETQTTPQDTTKKSAAGPWGGRRGLHTHTEIPKGSGYNFRQKKSSSSSSSFSLRFSPLFSSSPKKAPQAPGVAGTVFTHTLRFPKGLATILEKKVFVFFCFSLHSSSSFPKKRRRPLGGRERSAYTR